MKRTTAVRHLAEMAATATEDLRLRDSALGSPLQSLWVAGELLATSEVVEGAEMVLVLDLPPAELPWLALHPTGEWVSSRLGLGKRPVLWCYRPRAWPAWNARDRRVVRFWSEDEGVDDEVLESVRRGRVPAGSEPSAHDRHRQLREELAVSRRHLREVLDRYHDRTWRRERKGLGEGPDDHLWRAAQGVREIEDALEGGL